MLALTLTLSPGEREQHTDALQKTRSRIACRRWLVVRGRKLPNDSWLAMAQHAAKDSPSPGGEGRGEGGRFNKIIAWSGEQLELLKAAEKFGSEEGHKSRRGWRMENGRWIWFRAHRVHHFEYSFAILLVVRRNLSGFGFWSASLSRSNVFCQLNNLAIILGV